MRPGALASPAAPSTPRPCRPQPKKKKAAKRNLALLSFGNEAEAEEAELAAVAGAGSKIRSAHDVLEDERCAAAVLPGAAAACRGCLPRCCHRLGPSTPPPAPSGAHAATVATRRRRCRLAREAVDVEAELAAAREKAAAVAHVRGRLAKAAAEQQAAAEGEAGEGEGEGAAGAAAGGSLADRMRERLASKRRADLAGAEGGGKRSRSEEEPEGAWQPGRWPCCCPLPAAGAYARDTLRAAGASSC